MEKRIALGYVNATAYGYSPKVQTNGYVEVRYTEKKEGRKVFAASGGIKVGGRTIVYGQCLDELKELVGEDKKELMEELCDLWSKYHLNDLHPECQHQAELGWPEMAREEVEIKDYHLKLEVTRKQNELKKRCLQDLREGKTVTLTKEERDLLLLEYSIETEGELPESIAGFYEFKKTEKKARGWLPAEKFQSGILSKPCPVCGYKYGHGWNYSPIPKEDEQRILRLFETA